MKKTFAVLMMVLLVAMLFVSCDSNQTKTYNVGNDGPAGGIIFYVNPDAEKDGWTYLEVAKKDLGEYEFRSSAKEYYDTKTDIGEGKNNTELLKEKGIDTFPAAKACVEYNGGGKTDWFLPSKDELNLIYENLAKNKLIDVSSGHYWSSSCDASGGGGNAWAQYLDSGNPSSYSYAFPYYILPVRSF